MRWFAKSPESVPNEGDVRQITKFLWLPTKINHEWRWLEFATIEQKYRRLMFDRQRRHGIWIDQFWINGKKDLNLD